MENSNSFSRAISTDNINSAKAIETLLAVVGDADPEVRSQTAKVLGDARSAKAYSASLNGQEIRRRGRIPRAAVLFNPTEHRNLLAAKA